MVAIFGFVNKKKKTFDISSMLSNLTLQGTRQIKTWRSENVVLSHVQHKGQASPIIANMPDNSLIGVFEGDIFNQETLKKKLRIADYKGDDSALLLYLYAQEGPAIFADIIGNFAIAIWNSKIKKLILASDRFGLAPLYYYDSADVFIFCSEYQPIQELINFDKQLNHLAIAEYFYLGFTLKDKTFYKNIQSFPRASILNISNDEVRCTLYDSHDICIERGKPIAYYAEKVNFFFQEALKKRKQKVETATLSGGLDTRYILASLSPEDRKRMNFFTLKSAHLRPEEEKDVICALKLAKHFNLKHVLEPRPEHKFQEEYFDFMRSKVLQGCLWGQFGGELLGGYYQLLFYRENLPGNPDIFYKKIFPAFFQKKIIQDIPDVHDLCEYASSLNAHIGNPGALEKNTWLQWCIDILTRSFKTSIYKGVFGHWMYPRWFFMNNRIFPFIDQDFLKALLSVPPEYLTDNKLYIEIMKNYYPEVLLFPLSSNQITMFDQRINFCDDGFYWYSKQKNVYNDTVKKYLYKHCSVSKKIFLRLYRIKTSAKGVFLNLFNSESIGQLESNKKDENWNNIDIVRFLQFETWLRRYHFSVPT